MILTIVAGKSYTLKESRWFKFVFGKTLDNVLVRLTHSYERTRNPCVNVSYRVPYSDLNIQNTSNQTLT